MPPRKQVRRPLSGIVRTHDPAARVAAAAALLEQLQGDRDVLTDARDLAAMAAVVHDGRSVSDVVDAMGVWRTAFLKARDRVKAQHPGGPPPVPNAMGKVAAARKRIEKLDAYITEVRAVRDTGCQALADAGYRNFQIRDLSRVSSSYISQMDLDRGVESITSAQQARKALRAATDEGDAGRAEKVRSRAAEKGWALT